MGNSVDLTGKQFGRLTVLKKLDRREATTGSVLWVCKCQCGNEIAVPTARLKKQKGCGCLRTKNLLGMKFGMLLVISRLGVNEKGAVVWRCRCDCGKNTDLPTSRLTGYRTASCGCIIGAPRNMTGMRFGMLTAMSPTKDRHGRNVVWQCKCDCGKTALASTSSLVAGTKKSCGCGRRRNHNTLWRGCGLISGKFWGGIKISAQKRGIKVRMTIQDAWDLFQKQQMRCALSGLKINFADDYSDTTASLDRINSDGIYQPGNVQWVHKYINLMKCSLKQDEFKLFCRSVANNEMAITEFQDGGGI
jgi:hypothetical protein